MNTFYFISNKFVLMGLENKKDNPGKLLKYFKLFKSMILRVHWRIGNNPKGFDTIKIDRVKAFY